MPAYSTYPVWAFPPNWDNGITERLEWKTDVHVSEVGEEQRVSRRATPRRSYEATFLIQKNNRAYLEALMVASGTREILIPLWPNVTTLTAASSAGDSVLHLATDYREYTVGCAVFLRGPDAQTYEVGEVQSITGTSLQLISTLTGTWPAGTKVYPMAIVRLTESVQGNKKLDNLIELNTLFQFHQANPNSASWSPRRYREGLLYIYKPDDSEDLTRAYTRVYSILDNESGLPDRLDMIGMSQEKSTYRWAFAGRQKFEMFRRFLYYLRGRCKGVYLPTFMADMILAAPVNGADMYIDIQSVQYTALGLINKNRADIRIESQSGVAYRRIVGSTVLSPGVERILINSPLGATISDTGRYLISYVQPSRLDQDSVEIRHEADVDGLSTCQVTWFNGVNIAAQVGITTTVYPLYAVEAIQTGYATHGSSQLGVNRDAVESAFLTVACTFKDVVKFGYASPEAVESAFLTVASTYKDVVKFGSMPTEAVESALQSVAATLTYVSGGTITYSMKPEGIDTAFISVAATLT